MSDGEHFLGQFVNGLRQGYGTMTYRDGKVKQGNWDKNNFYGDNTKFE